MHYASYLAAIAWVISLTPPADVKANEPQALQATVKDAKGRPVVNANVQMIVTMVDMDHGEFKHEAKESAPGVYNAEAKFLMAGAWNVKVKTQIGSETAEKDFRIDVKR